MGGKKAEGKDQQFPYIEEKEKLIAEKRSGKKKTKKKENTLK